MQTYAIRDVVKLIITKEFYHHNVNPNKKKKAQTEERIFYDLIQWYGIMYKAKCNDKTYNNKWIIDWEKITTCYPELINSFDSIITDGGYYQPLITEEGITEIRKFLYEN